MRAARRAVACGALAGCVAALSGCLGLGARSPDEAVFACDRGFRAADWNSSARLKTGQSIARCHWLDGWSEARVARALGRRDFGPALAPEYVLPGGATTSKNLEEWLLKLRFGHGSRGLESARTETMPV
jgi:hypothetical protein